MANITKPMLAGRCFDTFKLQFPVWVTPKLDGIRCLKIKGKALSRNFKPIPNISITEWIERLIPDNTDGELIIPGAPFNETTSVVMSEDKPGDAVFYYIFDYVKDELTKPYVERMSDLKDLKIKGNVKLVLPVLINTEKELSKFEHKCLEDGFEGIMIRTENSPYKCGRSTEREGYLLKLKRFEDSEAEITGVEEKQHNGNVAEKDAFGRSKHSSHKAGMVPMGVLGAFLVKDIKTGIDFKIGSGYNDEQRKDYWDNQKKLIGKVVTYKFQPYGVKEAPRFPVFKGFRSKIDF